MKLIALFQIMLFSSFAAFSQSNDVSGVDSVPHRNYKYIHIVSVDSNQAAYRSFGQFLTDKGWSIGNGNIDFQSMTTLFSHIDKTAATIGYQITIRKNDIKLCIYRKASEGVTTPLLGSLVDMGSPELMLYKESNIWIIKKLWSQVTGMLSAYPHSKIYYSLD